MEEEDKTQEPSPDGLPPGYEWKGDTPPPKRVPMIIKEFKWDDLFDLMRNVEPFMMLEGKGEMASHDYYFSWNGKVFHLPPYTRFDEMTVHCRLEKSEREVQYIIFRGEAGLAAGMVVAIPEEKVIQRLCYSDYWAKLKDLMN